VIGKTRRTNRRLQAQVEALLEQRDDAIRERDVAVSLTSRQAQEINRLRDMATNWTRFARADERRSLRLANATVRYWAEIGRLRRQLRVQQRDAAERIGKLEDRLAVLQEANEAGYQKLFDRSSPPIAA
jgi:chromosome segregation ATPase